MAEITSTNLFEKIVLPSDFTDYDPLPEDARVAVKINDIANFNQKVEALITPDKQSSTEFISFAGISQKLAYLATPAQQYLNLGDISSTCQLKVNDSTSTSTTFNLEYPKYAVDNNILGAKNITIDFSVDFSNAILESTNITINSTNISSNDTYSFVVPENKLGVKAVEIDTELTSLNKDLDSTNIASFESGITPTNGAVGFKSVKVVPILSNLVVNTSNFTAEGAVMTPSSNAIGFADVTLPKCLKDTTILTHAKIEYEGNIALSSDMDNISIVSSYVDKGQDLSEIIDASGSTIKLESNTLLDANNITIKTPGILNYTLPVYSLFYGDTSENDNGAGDSIKELIIQSADNTKYIVNTITIPKIYTIREYTVTSADIEEAITNKSSSIIFDLEQATSSNVATSPVHHKKVKINLPAINIANQQTTYGTDLLSFNTNISGTLKELSELNDCDERDLDDFKIKSIKAYSAVSDGQTGLLTKGSELSLATLTNIKNANTTSIANNIKNTEIYIADKTCILDFNLEIDFDYAVNVQFSAKDKNLENSNISNKTVFNYAHPGKTLYRWQPNCFSEVACPRYNIELSTNRLANVNGEGYTNYIKVTNLTTGSDLSDAEISDLFAGVTNNLAHNLLAYDLRVERNNDTKHLCNNINYKSNINAINVKDYTDAIVCSHIQEDERYVSEGNVSVVEDSETLNQTEILDFILHDGLIFKVNLEKTLSERTIYSGNIVGSYSMPEIENPNSNQTLSLTLPENATLPVWVVTTTTSSVDDQGNPITVVSSNTISNFIDTVTFYNFTNQPVSDSPNVELKIELLPIEDDVNTEDVVEKFKWVTTPYTYDVVNACYIEGTTTETVAVYTNATKTYKYYFVIDENVKTITYYSLTNFEQKVFNTEPPERME